MAAVGLGEVHFEIHPEAWALAAAMVAVGIWVVRVLAPRAHRTVTRRQKAWYLAAVVTTLVWSVWPLHDIAEGHLFSVHMAQHMVMTLAVPPMLLMATPEWLARLIVGDGAGYRLVRWLTKPVVAGLAYNAVTALAHWPALVNASVEGPALLHYGEHVVWVTTALAMWTPVVGPLPELRITLPARMAYLFAMSILPTVPAGWLTFADGVLYSAYDTPARLWGLSVADDQQLAGLLMKVVGGMYLWTIIAVYFFRWADSQRTGGPVRVPPAVERLEGRPDTSGLTWDDVAAELVRSGPPPPEPPRPPRT